MVEIQWADPRPRHRGRQGPAQGDLDLVEALKANPGRWAIARDDCWPSVITGMRAGKYSAFLPPSEFEFLFQRHETIDNNKGRAFVRYVGPAQ